MKKKHEIVFDIMWKYLENERRYRYEDTEVGGDELSESIDMLKYKVETEIKAAFERNKNDNQS